MKRFNPVYIEWIDAIGDEGNWITWSQLQSMKELLVTSIGWIVEETDTHITLAGSVSCQCLMMRLTIPKISIVKRLNLVSNKGKLKILERG